MREQERASEELSTSFSSRSLPGRDDTHPRQDERATAVLLLLRSEGLVYSPTPTHPAIDSAGLVMGWESFHRSGLRLKHKDFADTGSRPSRDITLGLGGQLQSHAA